MSVHCDALYVHNDRRELICINDWLRRPAPAFWMGFTPEGILWRFREDVPAETRTRAERLIDHEANDPASQAPLNHSAYCALFGAQDAISGPTYWLSADPVLSGRPVQRVSAAYAAALNDSGLDAWIPDMPHQKPMFASLENGRAVAVCASVRSTPTAHEVGVETVPRHRRRGHGGAVVAAWAQELLRRDIIPLYSTSWDNLASRGLATGLGFEAFGWEYRIG